MSSSRLKIGIISTFSRQRQMYNEKIISLILPSPLLVPGGPSFLPRSYLDPYNPSILPRSHLDPYKPSNVLYQASYTLTTWDIIRSSLEIENMKKANSREFELNFFRNVVKIAFLFWFQLIHVPQKSCIFPNSAN